MYRNVSNILLWKKKMANDVKQFSQMQHFDMGNRGSHFTILHPPVKSRPLFITLLFALLATAFSFGLHLLDSKSLIKVLILLVVCSLLKLSSKIYSESITILPSLGLQLETRYYLGHVSSHFICLSQVKDIVISEAVTMHSILTYLVVLLNEEDSAQQQRLYPLFTDGARDETVT